jgi:hypothetical protein
MIQLRRLVLLAVAVITVVVTFNTAKPAQAAFSNVTFSISCSVISVSGNSSVGFTDQGFPGGGVWVVVYDFTLDDFIVDEYVPLSNGDFSFSTTFSVDPSHDIIFDIWDDTEDPRTLHVGSCGSAAAASCPFTDGRLNNCDAGQTAAIYCAKDGTVTGLAIYKGVGYPGIVATAAEIAAVPEHPTKNTLIKQGNGVRLYRLTSGELQINRAEDYMGKDYSYRFTCEPKK